MKQKDLKNFIKVINLLITISIVLWVPIAFSTLFFFDAPGSENNLFTQALAGSIWFYPVMAITGIVKSRDAYKADDLSNSFKFSLIPVGWLIVIGLIIYALVFFCGGRFTCD